MANVSTCRVPDDQIAYITAERKPSGHHPFNQECLARGIDHRLIKPGRPQTNGMAERFNSRISDVLATRRYTSGEDLEQTLKRYCWLCNHHIPQKALYHLSLIIGDEGMAGQAT